MKFTLKDYQDEAVRDVLENLRDARDFWRSRKRKSAFSLTATDLPLRFSSTRS
jgi:hypothetical protein